MTTKKRVLTDDDLKAFDYEACKKVVSNIFAKYRQYLQSKEEYEELLNYSSPSYDQPKVDCSGYRNDVEKIIMRIDELKEKMHDLDVVIESNIDTLDIIETKIFNGMILHYLSSRDLECELNRKRDFITRYKKSCYIKVAKWFHEEVYK